MTPLNNNLPADPSLIILLFDASDPLIIPDTAIFPVLVVPKVIPAVFVIPPVIVKVLVPELTSVLILVALAAVIVPDNVGVEVDVLSNLMAPVLLTPVPFNVIASGIVIAVVALISIAVPSTIVVPCELAKVPNASVLLNCTTPAVIEVVPA